MPFELYSALIANHKKDKVQIEYYFLIYILTWVTLYWYEMSTAILVYSFIT